MTWAEFGARAAEGWPIIAAAVGFAGAAAGWWARGAWLRGRVAVHPVLDARRRIVGWRAHLGRLSIGDRRPSRRDAARHADKIKESL